MSKRATAQALADALAETERLRRELLASEERNRAIAEEYGQVLAREQAARTRAAAVGAQLRAVLDVLPVGVIIADADGRMLHINAAGRHIWGEQAPLAQLADAYDQLTARRLDTGERLAAHDWAMAKALTAGTSTLGEELLIESFDGQRKVVLHSGVAIRDEAGTIAGAVTASLDITNRKRLEHDLTERAGTLEAMFEAITDGIGMLDHDGHLAYINAAGRALVGLGSSDDAEHFFTLTPHERAMRLTMRDDCGQPLPDDDVPARRILHGGVLGGSTAVDVRVRTLDGRDMCWNVSGAPIRDAAWRIIGGVMLFQDVTQRRQMERELETHANDLETASRRMDEFLGIASHELRTPMTTIRANVQLARRHVQRALNGQFDAPALVRAIEQVYTMLERSDRQVERQNRLVNDLLDVSRIQAGRLEMHPEPCDLAAIVRDAVDEQQMGNDERTITLDAPERAVPLIADADRVGQVVTNFLTNALKYSTRDKPVAVTVRAEGGVAHIAVRDEGPGLPPEQCEHIWERFHRVPGVEVLTGSGIGLGLGLYISRTIVERHGGTLGVESAEGDGSTFWFTLPLAPAGG